MDIRNDVLGILVGGTPAPGINGVIAAITLEAIHQNLTVIGFYEGWKRMKQGISLCTTLTAEDVTRIAHTGGSILRTSKKQPQDAKEIDNALRVLELHRVRYLVTIGGTNTAYSAYQVAKQANRGHTRMSIIHVPKTIFNDLPLPDGARTFGFSTAREVGMYLIRNFQNDARTMLRWYILVVMGQKAGHLALGMGKAAAATITLIPEEFKASGRTVSFNQLCDTIEAVIYKRKAQGKEYGIAVLSEGMIDMMDKKEIEDRWGAGDAGYDAGHQELGRHISVELLKRFAKKNLDVTVKFSNIGNECRAADPNGDDVVLTRDLGFGAVRLLLEGVTNSIVTMKNMMDPKTGQTRIREVDVRKMGYLVARTYQIRLLKRDLDDPDMLVKLAQTSGLSADEILKRFSYVADDDVRKHASVLDALNSEGGVFYVDKSVAEQELSAPRPTTPTSHTPTATGRASPPTTPPTTTAASVKSVLSAVGTPLGVVVTAHPPSPLLLPAESKAAPPVSSSVSSRGTRAIVSVRSLFDAFNRRDWGKMQALLAADCVFTSVRAQKSNTGAKAVVQFFQDIYSKHGDAAIDVERVNAGGEHVTVEYTLRYAEKEVTTTQHVCEVMNVVDGIIHGGRVYS